MTEKHPADSHVSAWSPPFGYSVELFNSHVVAENVFGF